MSNPLISVIVPIYKVEDYLCRCVDSIIAQEYTNLEIILVDDGSPDNCPKICDDYAQKDNRVKVVHKENGGLSDARNAGMKVAAGEYVSFIDSDDFIDSRFIIELYNGIKKGADVAECATRLFDENDNTLSTRGSEEGIIDRDEALKRLVCEDGIYQTVVDKLYLREAIKDIPFLKGKYHEDDFWTWQVLKKSNRIYCCEKPLYNYLQRNTGITGVGYSLKRLDGVQARYERMIGLSDVPVVKNLANISFASILMYNLQAASKFLKGDEKKQAKQRIMNYKKEFKLTEDDYGYIDSRTKMWLKLFMTIPHTTVAVRNIFGIGY